MVASGLKTSFSTSANTEMAAQGSGHDEQGDGESPSQTSSLPVPGVVDVPTPLTEKNGLSRVAPLVDEEIKMHHITVEIPAVVGT